MKKAYLVVGVVVLVLTCGLFLCVLHLPSSTQRTSVSAIGTDAAKREFVYQGRPIHPACFVDVENSPDARDLTACSKAYAGDTWTKPKTDAEGFFSSEDHEADAHGAYTAYKVLGKVGDVFVLYMQWSGGGSGQFTEIDLVRLSGDTFTSTNVAMGDRCNGNVDVDALRGSIVSFESSITPYDLIVLGATTTEAGYQTTVVLPGGSKLASDKLDASAVSCYGSAKFSYDIASDKLDFVGAKIDFGSAYDIGSMHGGDSVQDCLNVLAADSVRAGKSEFTPQELRTFAAQFEKRCVR